MLRFIIIVISFVPVHAFTQDASEYVSTDLAMYAIGVLRADPTSADAREAASIIVKYAQESPDVLVEIGPNHLPWEHGTIDRNAAVVLLAAFVAGGVEYQIANQVKEPRPLEGILFLVGVYDALRNSGGVEPIPKLEEWLQTTKEGRVVEVPTSD